jgi:hypothetical protein
MGRTCFACRGELKCIYSFVWENGKTETNLVKRSWENNNKMGLRWNGTVCGLDSTDSR